MFPVTIRLLSVKITFHINLLYLSKVHHWSKQHIIFQIWVIIIKYKSNILLEIHLNEINDFFFLSLAHISLDGYYLLLKSHSYYISSAPIFGFYRCESWEVIFT